MHNLAYTQLLKGFVSLNMEKHFVSYKEIEEPPHVALGRGGGRGRRGRGRGDTRPPLPERPTRVQENFFNTIVSNDKKIYGPEFGDCEFIMKSNFTDFTQYKQCWCDYNFIKKSDKIISLYDN
ncbi:hypothetical protein Glove_87g145 [Diversispora epigaea]|uniref:Uncharacterized protein n=1 Tax=Diversispora epigaea TaxID=1348612 RepID=A0A397JF07_9GLOM|nr:hypothetical protein Glove_87g145 [Diversispora epigaea]